MDGLVEILEGAGLKHIIMPRKAYIKEHRNLVRLLNRSNIPALKKEAADQIKEVRDATGVRLGGRRKDVQTLEFPVQLPDVTDTAIAKFQRLWNEGYLDHIFYDHTEDEQEDMKKEAIEVLTDMEGASIHLGAVLRERHPQFFEAVDKMEEDDRARQEAEEAALEAARANWAANRRGRRGKNVEAEDDDSKTGEGRRHFGTLVSRRRKDRVITPELK